MDIDTLVLRVLNFAATSNPFVGFIKEAFPDLLYLQACKLGCNICSDDSQILPPGGKTQPEDKVGQPFISFSNLTFKAVIQYFCEIVWTGGVLLFGRITSNLLMSHSLALKENQGQEKQSALMNSCTLYHRVSLYKTADFNYGGKGDSIFHQSVNP